MRARSMVFGLSVVLGACVGYSPPVPVRGEAALLEGRWVGEYENVILGRSGSIDFILGPGRDTATGSVLMIPARGDRRIWGTRGPEPGAVIESPVFLQIQLVRMQGHRVSGQLAAYRDPESGVMVTTSFSGYLEGDVIEGKFFTVEQNSEWAVEGRWRVTRQH